MPLPAISEAIVVARLEGPRHTEIPVGVIAAVGVPLRRAEGGRILPVERILEARRDEVVVRGIEEYAPREVDDHVVAEALRPVPDGLIDGSDIIERERRSESLSGGMVIDEQLRLLLRYTIDLAIVHLACTAVRVARLHREHIEKLRIDHQLPSTHPNFARDVLGKRLIGCGVEAVEGYEIGNVACEGDRLPLEAAVCETAADG